MPSIPTIPSTCVMTSTIPTSMMSAKLSRSSSVPPAIAPRKQFSTAAIASHADKEGMRPAANWQSEPSKAPNIPARQPLPNAYDGKAAPNIVSNPVEMQADPALQTVVIIACHQLIQGAVAIEMTEAGNEVIATAMHHSSSPPIRLLCRTAIGQHPKGTFSWN